MKAWKDPRHPEFAAVDVSYLENLELLREDSIVTRAAIANEELCDFQWAHDVTFQQPNTLYVSRAQFGLMCTLHPGWAVNRTLMGELVSFFA